MIHRVAFAFTISLISLITLEIPVISQRPEPVPPPPDVAAAPSDATKTASGLAWKVLAPGKGGAQPAANDAVIVHYTAWTTDGKMFDNSHARRVPTSRVPVVV